MCSSPGERLRTVVRIVSSLIDDIEPEQAVGKQQHCARARLDLLRC